MRSEVSQSLSGGCLHEKKETKKPHSKWQNTNLARVRHCPSRLTQTTHPVRCWLRPLTPPYLCHIRKAPTKPQFQQDVKIWRQTEDFLNNSPWLPDEGSEELKMGYDIGTFKGSLDIKRVTSLN